jgi:hypothetical protein
VDRALGAVALAPQPYDAEFVLVSGDAAIPSHLARHGRINA